MAEDGRDREALRRRLYRRDASPEDVDSYLRVAPATPTPSAFRGLGRPGGVPAAPQPGAEPDPVVARRRRRPFVVAGAAAAVALGGAALGVGALAPAPMPSSASPTAAWTAAPRDPGDSLVAMAVLDRGRRAHASGRAVPSPGGGTLYTVAAGDSMAAVATRFGLCTADVLVALPYGADPRRPPAGQQLLLERGAGTPARAC